MEASIRAAVANSTTPTATIDAIDCRTRTCLLTVRFLNRDQAFSDSEKLVRAHYAKACLVQAILPSESDGAVAVRVLYSC